MAKDKEPLEAFTATAAQTAEQMTKQTQGGLFWLAAKRPCQRFLGVTLI